jgi:hypothetical protein
LRASKADADGFGAICHGESIMRTTESIAFRSVQITASLLGIVLLFACGKEAPVGGSPNGSGGAGGSKVVVLLDSGLPVVYGIDGGGTAGTQGTPTIDANCGAVISDMRQQPANLLLVLDRSTSMSWDISRDDRECAPTDTTCQQRWATVTQTLDQILGASPATIRWGLKLFATPVPADVGADENCTVTPGVDVGVGDGTASVIRDTIRASEPLGYTPTLLGLQNGIQYLKELQDPYQRYILLATDGEPNCDGASATTSGAVQTNHVIDEISAAAAAGIKVYVVGLGPSTNLRNLDKFAVAGQTEHYYPATSAAELEAALSAIVGQVASCTFSLASPPPDPNNLGVYLDKHIVPRASTDGWILAADHLSVTFVGSYCDGIKAGSYRQVQVYFGCPNSELPTFIP